MSKEVLMEIVNRATSDEAFRELLFSNPVKALTGYDLSAAEVAALSNLNEDNFSDFVGKLDDRGTKGWVIPGG